MRALYFHGTPIDWEANKAKQPLLTTAMGAPIYCSEVLDALLMYSTLDRIYLPEISPGRREQVLSLPTISANLDRITFVQERSWASMAGTENLYIMSPNSNLQELTPIREKTQKPDAPLIGVVHSINLSIYYDSFLDESLHDLLSPVCPHDAYFVSSHAGIFAMKKRIALAHSTHFGNSDICWASLPQLIHMPLGVSIEDFSRPDGSTVARLRKQYQLPPDATIILYFGRFSAVSKGDLLPLLLTFSTLPYVQEQLHLVLAGDDTQFQMAGTLSDFAYELGCAKYVHVLANPSRDEKLHLYKMADIFVSPSDCIQETFGITLSEAMAASLPVIASDWNGYRDIVIHGETGLLIPTLMPDYDSISGELDAAKSALSDEFLARTTIVSQPDLFRALATLSSNRDLRERMGHSSRRRAEALYDWRRVIENYEDTWRRLQLQAVERGGVGILEPPARGLVYSYKEIFGHYATGFLSVTNAVEPAEIPISPHQIQEILRMICTPTNIFSVELLLNILHHVEERRRCVIGELLANLKDTHIPEQNGPANWQMTCVSHLARLAKYGLLRIAKH